MSFISGLLRFACVTVLAGYCIEDSRACSLASGYETPTNFELVKSADAIVLATVVGSRGNPFDDPQILAKPALSIKGSTTSDDLQFRGFLSSVVFKLNGKYLRNTARRSLPYDIYRAHPNSFGGSCNRYIFEVGMKLVLFLERTPEGPRVIMWPYSRSLEDVQSDNALWVEAVKLYVVFANLPAHVQRPAMLRAVTFLREMPHNAEAVLLADDIDRQLLGCKPPGGLFEGRDEPCGKPQWAYNMLNYEFERMPEPVEVKPPSGAGKAKPFFWLNVLASMVVVALSTGFLISRRSSSNSDSNISH